MAKLKVSQELIDDLKSLMDQFDLDETPVRERQIRMWKKLWYFFEGYTRIWWDDVAHDWRVFDDGFGYDTNGMGYYDKPMNVFRAYLETIIAALSSTVPAVKAMPDDANSTLDVLTARGATDIAALIGRHNDVSLIWVKALYTYCIQGMVAAYTETVEHKKFGEVKVEDYKDEQQDVELTLCPTCGMDIELSQGIGQALMSLDEFDPKAEEAPLHYLYREGKVVCPNCQDAIDPIHKTEKVTVPRFVGMTSQPKSRQKITVLGGLWVKVPNWARTQEECPYLGYDYETHYTNVYEMFPNIAKDFHTDGGLIEEFGNQAYERWGRLNPQYYSEYPKATPTVRMRWFRPSAYHAIDDEAVRAELKRKFPDGVKITFVNETFADIKAESLDDHWTLTKNPLSQYLHFDPIGMLVTSVQEITQDLLSLTLQTIEHGIPQTFADPKVLNFEQYKNTEVMPGGVYPTKMGAGGKSVADGFHVLTTATLSAEVMPFGQMVQSMAQFTSGALPSLFGGQSARGSETAAEYSMSRNQALQRLQNTWKMVNVWWKEIFGKVIPAFIENMIEDEKFTEQKDGKFLNIVIRRAELEGKIGSFEIEASDRLPATWGQIKDTVMQLLEMQSPLIQEALSSPENRGILQDAIGLSTFKIPGETDREKQLEEIKQLVNSEPLFDGMQEQPSIMPDYDVDNHQLEAEIVREWAVSEEGRVTKAENPNGYKNAILHMKMHIQMMQFKMQQQAMMQAPQQVPPQSQGDEAANKNKLRPIKDTNEQRQPTGTATGQ